MKRDLKGWLFVFPALLHLVVFGIAPIGFAIFISMFEWNLLKGSSRFVGVSNYGRVFQDGDFLHALGNSAVYTLASVPIGAAVALAVALLVSQKIRGMAVFRTILYLPAVCSQVAIAMV